MRRWRVRSAGQSVETIQRPGVGCEFNFAQDAHEVASTMLPPCPVYVLDICQVGDEFRLIELNPFGGSDLCECDSEAVVEAVSDYAIRDREQ